MLDSYEQQDNEQHYHSKCCRQQCDKEAPVGEKMQHLTFQPRTWSHQPSLTRAANRIGRLGLMASTIEGCEEISSPVVPPTHAVIQPFAMVIKVFHTLVANSAVLHFRAAELTKKTKKQHCYFQLAHVVDDPVNDISAAAVVTYTLMSQR